MERAQVMNETDTDTDGHNPEETHPESVDTHLDSTEQDVTTDNPADFLGKHVPAAKYNTSVAFALNLRNIVRP